MTDIDAIRNRAYHAANNRHRWASEVGVTDVDVLDGLRRAKQLAVDDVPALLAKVDELTAELAKIADSIAPTVTVKPVSDAVWFLHGLYKDWAAKAHEQQAKVDELTAALIDAQASHQATLRNQSALSAEVVRLRAVLHKGGAL